MKVYKKRVNGIIIQFSAHIQVTFSLKSIELYQKHGSDATRINPHVAQLKDGQTDRALPWQADMRLIFEKWFCFLPSF